MYFQIKNTFESYTSPQYILNNTKLNSFLFLIKLQLQPIKLDLSTCH
jgi:hypothetical protein